MQPKLRKVGRIKPKYNPQPNAVEARHEERLREMPCVGCGAWGVICHHVLAEFPAKRFRRDHRFQLPLCDPCHRELHAMADEAAWAAMRGLRDTGEIAQDLWALSEEAERRAA